MDNGWIKLHRDLIKWEWYKTPNMVHFFIHCLLRANHSEQKWQGKTVLAGEFISGRKQLSMETGLSEQSVRTCIKRLKSTSELTIKNKVKYSVFTLNNWNIYQSKILPTSEATSKQPASNQQVTTNKNDKNENNEKNKTYTRLFDHFWEVYPKRKGKKVGKQNAFKNFKKISSEDLQRVIQNATNYGIDNEFPKDPERFLKDGFWEDWDQPQQKGNYGQKSYADRQADELSKIEQSIIQPRT